MKIKTVLGAMAVAYAATATMAHAETKDEPRGRDCVFARQPQDWRVLDSTHLVLWGPSQKQAYLVTLFAPLAEMAFAETLAFIDDDHDGQICNGDKIAVPDRPGAGFPATITSMRRVNEAELLTLGEQYKVKLLSDKRAVELKQHDKQIHGATTSSAAP